MTQNNVLPLPSRTDSEAEPCEKGLLSGCKLRDGEAMSRFFDQHSRSIYRFLARLYPGYQADLDDMVHTTFVKAIESVKTFREQSSVRTWLFGIALNIGRQHVRKERRRTLLLDLFFGHADAPSVPQPDELLANQQDRFRLTCALAKLPQDQRTVFVLCDLEGLSGKNAAEIIGIPQGTLGRRLFEARRGLRAALQEGEA